MPGPFPLDDSDAALTQRLRASDEAAFEVLFRRHYDALYGFVARRLPADHADTPADVVQDLFLRLWQQRARLDPDQSVRAYLFQAASRLVIDRYRHRAVRQAFQEAEQRKPSPTVAPVEHVDVEPAVWEAINALPEPVRTVFILSRFDGLTYREMATLLGLSPKTIEARMSKALRLLRTALQPYLSLMVGALTAAWVWTLMGGR
ncbi:MAG: RNA polymerase sigma-70 factor [Bacteroidota bacterium]